MSIHNFPSEAKAHTLDMFGGPGSSAENKCFQAQGLGYLWGFGTSVPTDADTGWAAGAFYIHTDATGDTDTFYVNLGDTSSANFDSIGDTSLIADLASTANGLGASLIGVEDAAAVITGTTVEAVLAELAAFRVSEALATDTAAAVEGISTLNGTASCDVTLADASIIGTRKMFRAITSIANPPTVTVATTHQGASRSVYTFGVIGDSLVLEWDGLQWVDVGGNIGPVETATGTFTLSAYGTTDINAASAVTGTLGAGDYTGQIKVITMSINADNSSTVSITNHLTSDPEVATFDALDETGVFIWTGTEWDTILATCTFV